jgi:site-specific DNA recombinase
MLTGSASKGRYNHYYYYHCVSSCGCRFKAGNANSLFVRELKKYVPHPGMSEIYVATIYEAYNDKPNT